MKYLWFVLLLWVAYPAVALDVEPEPASALTEKQAVEATQAMAVTAHPLATQAAFDTLKAGGSAVDAAIAAQLVLGLVEPQSSGIGGGGFMLHYAAGNEQITSYDGRETAPGTARADMFLHQGKPMPFMRAVKSGDAVGTPGLLAMLHQAHQEQGKLPWKELFTPAITLARKGFTVTPRLQESIAYAAQFSASDAFKALYFDNEGEPLAAGATLKNPQLAELLEAIAQKGPQVFYKGYIAQEIANAVQQAGGNLTIDDLAAYEPTKRAALCDHYREYRICSMAPPSSGGLTILQALKLLEPFNLSMAYGIRETHLILEAEKLAFADRDHFIADPDFVKVPSAALLEEGYLKKRRTLIDESRASRSKAKPGNPSHGTDNSHDLPSTTHLSIIDTQGNAVSLTSSVEHGFGSSIIAHGMVLNNQMTDFAFQPVVDGKPVANRVEPYKRPRSSMSPTLIFHPNDKLHMVVGSPGGSGIIGYVLKTIIGVLDWDLPLQDIINAPHFMHKNQESTLLETNHPDAEWLRKMRHQVTQKPLTSGIHAILIKEDGTLVGAADPRREGIALGY